MLNNHISKLSWDATKFTFSSDESNAILNSVLISSSSTNRKAITSWSHRGSSYSMFNLFPFFSCWEDDSRMLRYLWQALSEPCPNWNIMLIALCETCRPGVSKVFGQTPPTEHQLPTLYIIMSSFKWHILNKTWRGVLLLENARVVWYCKTKSRVVCICTNSSIICCIAYTLSCTLFTSGELKSTSTIAGMMETGCFGSKLNCKILSN